MRDTELSTFDHHVAEAVVRVLRRHGFDAWLASPTAVDAGERAVHVSPGERESALALLAEHMEEVTGELADGPGRLRRGQPGAAAARAEAQVDERARTEGWDDDTATPLVMERFRRIGLNIAILLAPLLIVALARPPFPFTLTVITVVAGMALIVALRNRQLRGRGDGR